MRFSWDYGIVFVVDFSDLNDIRSFSRVLLGFVWVDRILLGCLRLFLVIFRVG